MEAAMGTNVRLRFSASLKVLLDTTLVSGEVLLAVVAAVRLLEGRVFSFKMASQHYVFPQNSCDTQDR